MPRCIAIAVEIEHGITGELIRLKARELDGHALDWAVARAAGVPPHWTFQPSSNWEDGGPIIEREVIVLDYYPDEGRPGGGDWEAIISDSEIAVSAMGPTPLIAAMRCYVVAMLGDDVEIPNNLCVE